MLGHSHWTQGQAKGLRVSGRFPLVEPQQRHARIRSGTQDGEPSRGQLAALRLCLGGGMLVLGHSGPLPQLRVGPGLSE